MKVHLIIGLPGAGKSHYIQSLKHQGIVQHGIHDYYKESPCLKEGVTDPRRSLHYDKLMNAIKDNKSIAVADIIFVMEAELNKMIAFLEELGVEYELHAFTNRPDLSMRNIVERNVRMGENPIRVVNGFRQFIEAVMDDYHPERLDCTLIHTFDRKNYE